MSYKRPMFFLFFFGGGAPGTCFAVEEMLHRGYFSQSFVFFFSLFWTDFSLQRLILESAYCASQLKRRALFLRPCECRPERSQIYRQPTSTVLLSEIRMQRILSNTRQCILGNARQCILGNTRQCKAMQCLLHNRHPFFQTTATEKL